MKIAVLGTGMVGATIGAKLIELGHEVKMGSRSADNEKAAAFVQQNGPRATQGTFADAAAFGEMVFICTKGDATLQALELAGADHLRGKTLIDISNPLNFSNGMPPSLFVCNTDSLGEQIQRAFPDAHVVKTLNIVNCLVMVEPAKSGGDPTMFVSGNNAGAKAQATDMLHAFGWTDIIDLGDITTARGTEQLLPIWVRTWMATGNGLFAFKVVR